MDGADACFLPPARGLSQWTHVPICVYKMSLMCRGKSGPRGEEGKRARVGGGRGRDPRGEAGPLREQSLSCIVGTLFGQNHHRIVTRVSPDHQHPVVYSIETRSRHVCSKFLQNAPPAPRCRWQGVAGVSRWERRSVRVGCIGCIDIRIFPTRTVRVLPAVHSLVRTALPVGRRRPELQRDSQLLEGREG